MSILIWRDSVAMGDDADAPHEWAVPGTPDMSLATIVALMLRTRYLASISGGRATWILMGARPLAVIAQQWDAPRWLVAPETTVGSIRRPSAPPDLEVRYWCQVDPDRVYTCLESGEPLPDRYGA